MIEVRLELAGNEGGIFGSKAKGNEGAGVAQDGMPNVGLQLMQVLVREHHADAELAELRKHVGDRQRREVLELVDVDEERPALFSGMSARL